MKKIFILFFMLVNILLYSQEVIKGLRSNPCLYDNLFITDSYKSPLSIPFLDDFSGDNFIANNSLWQKSSVFINRSYPVNPPTLGVATFDGLNDKGLAYLIDVSNPYGSADTLLSKPIDLSNINVAYLMFYYQPQGIGDNPQVEDSLILEFRDLNGNWNVIWKKPGDYMYEFKRKIIMLDNVNYLYNNFQFRFRNKSTLSGNFDHWHIDYIKIDEYNTSSDTNNLDDVAFVYSSPSFLKRYNEMPWSHFVNNEIFELSDTIDILIRNNNASTNIDYQYNVFENNSQIAHYPTLGVSRNATVLDYNTIGNFSFTSPPISVSSSVFNSIIPDSLTFIIQHIIGTGQSDFKENDTLYRKQDFFSHFSYDDGVAESAYGINTDGAKIAYQFKLNRPDTLRAVEMYFPQMLDTVNNVNFIFGTVVTVIV